MPFISNWVCPRIEKVALYQCFCFSWGLQCCFGMWSGSLWSVWSDCFSFCCCSEIFMKDVQGPLRYTEHGEDSGWWSFASHPYNHTVFKLDRSIWMKKIWKLQKNTIWWKRSLEWKTIEDELNLKTEFVSCTFFPFARSVLRNYGSFYWQRVKSLH